MAATADTAVAAVSDENRLDETRPDWARLQTCLDSTAVRRNSFELKIVGRMWLAFVFNH